MNPSCKRTWIDRVRSNFHLFLTVLKQALKKKIIRCEGDAAGTSEEVIASNRVIE